MTYSTGLARILAAARQPGEAHDGALPAFYKLVKNCYLLLNNGSMGEELDRESAGGRLAAARGLPLTNP